MNYPEYVMIGETRYDIDTYFKTGIRCSEVAEDPNIDDEERGMAIVYLLFGEKGLRSNDRKQLLKEGMKYLACGKEVEHTNEEPDMDFVQDYSLIKTSFRSDYGIKLDEEKMHWWEFNELLNGLSNSDMGNCCILNRVRSIRTFDIKDIKDRKERDQILKAKEHFALKKNKRESHLTKEQEESMRRFNEMANIRR